MKPNYRTLIIRASPPARWFITRFAERKKKQIRRCDFFSPTAYVSYRYGHLRARHTPLSGTRGDVTTGRTWKLDGARHRLLVCRPAIGLLSIGKTARAKRTGLGIIRENGSDDDLSFSGTYASRLSRDSTRGAWNWNRIIVALITHRDNGSNKISGSIGRNRDGFTDKHARKSIRRRSRVCKSLCVRYIRK